MTTLICTELEKYSSQFTRGRAYEVVAQDNGFYVVIDDRGETSLVTDTTLRSPIGFMHHDDRAAEPLYAYFTPANSGTTDEE